jgi:MSHA biogenesis protein MshN
VSLINKMLKDLDARQSAGARETPRPMYQDLRPTRGGGRASRPSVAPLLIVLALVSLLAGSGYFIWQEWGERWIAQAPEKAPLMASGSAEPAPAAGVAAPATAEPLVTPAPAPAVSTPRTAGAPVVKAAPRTQPVRPGAEAPARVARRPAPAEPQETGGKVEKTLKPMSPQEQAELRYREAAALVTQGRAIEGEPKLREALAADATHAGARELLAGILLQGGRADEARAVLEQGVENNPKHTPFARLLARLYVDAGAEGRAIELLERTNAAAPNDAEVNAFLATLYQRAARHDDAIRSFTAALKLRPQEGRWWIGLGISQEANRNSGAAAESYQRAAASPALDARLRQFAQGRLAALKK